MHACQHIHASLACAALSCVCVWIFGAHAFQVTTQLHAQGPASTQFVSVRILFQLHTLQMQIAHTMYELGGMCQFLVCFCILLRSCHSIRIYTCRNAMLALCSLPTHIPLHAWLLRASTYIASLKAAIVFCTRRPPDLRFAL